MGVICISCRTNMGFNYNINMKIKKVSEDVAYIKKGWTDKYEVNGKEVRFYGYNIQDMEMDEYDGGYDMDENDREKLTDEEVEMFDFNESELMDLKVGVAIEVEE